MKGDTICKASGVTPSKWQLLICAHMRPCFIPALLSFQQLPVGGNLNVKSHLNIQQVLVFTKVASHFFLHVLNLILQAANSVLVVSSFDSKVLFHFPHLAFQGFVLQEVGKASNVTSQKNPATPRFIYRPLGTIALPGKWGTLPF